MTCQYKPYSQKLQQSLEQWMPSINDKETNTQERYILVFHLEPYSVRSGNIVWIIIITFKLT